MHSDGVVRTVLDFTTGWTLLNDFQYLADDAAKMEVVRQLFDHMCSEAFDFISNVRRKGINYEMVVNTGQPHLNLNALTYVKQQDDPLLAQLAAYIWGLLDYNNLFVKQSQAGSLSDDFPFALEYVNRQVLVLVSSPINDQITNKAAQALTGRRI